MEPSSITRLFWHRKPQPGVLGKNSREHRRLHEHTGSKSDGSCSARNPPPRQDCYLKSSGVGLYSPPIRPFCFKQRYRCRHARHKWRHPSFVEWLCYSKCSRSLPGRSAFYVLHSPFLMFIHYLTNFPNSWLGLYSCRTIVAQVTCSPRLCWWKKTVRMPGFSGGYITKAENQLSIPNSNVHV